MKIKNKHIMHIFDLLNALELPIRHSRLRTRFTIAIQEHFNSTYRRELNDLINEFAEKDDEGKVIMGENGTFTIPSIDYHSYQTEMENLDNEVMEFDLNEQNKEMLLAVSNIIFNDDYIQKLSGNQAEAHYHLCNEAERVIEYYNLKETE